MSAIKFTELKCINARLYRGGTGSGDCTFSVLAGNHTSTNGTYMDALKRVLSTSTKIREAQ